MSVIENFSTLLDWQLGQFATVLVSKINAENTFSNLIDFTIDSFEADDITGNLIIYLRHEEYLEVEREATWTCEDIHSVDQDPGSSADYENAIFTDVKKCFKTQTAQIEGYTVTLRIDDTDVVETVEVIADVYQEEDNGIGDYEYFGARGYDSDPYVEVEGRIIAACQCALTLIVEPTK